VALQEEQKEASLAVLSAAEEHSHAATRHLYFQRAQLQLLLRQLIFCASELSGGQPPEASLRLSIQIQKPIAVHVVAMESAVLLSHISTTTCQVSWGIGCRYELPAFGDKMLIEHHPSNSTHVLAVAGD
jgi:hypothetical protein